MNEMLDSQLSAMFDDELPAEECELVARRLSRDEAMQSRWRHYALIGAAVRGERGLALEVDIASRVRKAVAVESDLAAAHPAVAMPQSRLVRRAWQGVAGFGIAAGVAALSVLWMRAQTPEENSQPLMAQVQLPAPVRAAPSGPDSYVVPTPVNSPNAVPTAELANYVLSHSEYSGPLIRRNVLSSLVASDPGTAAPIPDSEPSVKPDTDRP
jgi:negative regulator of sigma E activity